MNGKALKKPHCYGTSLGDEIMEISLYAVAALLGVIFRYSLGMVEACRVIGVNLSDSESDTGFQDAITPPYSSNFSILIWIAVAGVLGFSAYQFSWGAFGIALAVFCGTGIVAGAALIPKHTVKHVLKEDLNIKKDSYTEKNYFKTLLLEGTGNVYPFKISKQSVKEINKNRKIIEKAIPSLKTTSKCDFNTSGFYHYAISMMSDYYWKEHGIIDYTIVNNNKYGVSFKDWWDGNYVLKPNMKHNKKSIELVQNILEYDKPIPPITYKSTINEKNYSSTLLRYGYKINDKQSLDIHKNILKKLKTLNKLFFVKYNIIDHECSHWVELFFVKINDEFSSMSSSESSDLRFISSGSSSSPGLILL